MHQSHPSKSVIVLFAGADPDRPFDIEDENLAVADRAGFRGIFDRFDDAIRSPDEAFLVVFTNDPRNESNFF
jgi:hypothetical protein